MNKLCIFFFSFIWIAAAGLFPCYSSGNEALQKQENQPFTNKDLERYNQTPEKKPAAPETKAKEIKNEKTEKIRLQKEKEYWCKITTPFRRKIEKIKEDIWEIEKSSKITKKSKKRLEAAKKQLKAAEQDLADLEDEAHRKRIPPGWLRCQFE